MKKGIALLLLIALCAISYIRTDSVEQDPYLITDYSRLRPVKVERVAAGMEEEQLAGLVQEAQEQNKTISIAGQRHSQGGHTYYEDGIVVDMTTYNRILSIEPEARLIRVQAGATWADVQEAINPYGLAVKTMQSQNIFTIGGSISINAHGRDIRNGSLIKSVESFRLLTANAEIVNVSRTENAELFPLVLGGFGLFGIILDVTLSLTEDEVYQIETNTMNAEQYVRVLDEQILSDPAIRMHIARISVAEEGFMDAMYTVNYRAMPELALAEHNRLKTKEAWVIPAKLMFQLNRVSEWGKNQFWYLQSLQNKQLDGQIISRNNAMRSGSQFMEYAQPGSNDLLQEYFIPKDQFVPFLKKMGQVLREEELNLLNITVRYVNEDEEAVLSYAQEDMLALVCLFHTPLTDSAQDRMRSGIRKLLDEVIAHRGTYYLPYVSYPSVEQFRQVYPRYEEFFQAKDRFDPEGRFWNYFAEEYGGR
jgi:decaprenylphospho-beta-D-ribofuranose 2-oxidase